MKKHIPNLITLGNLYCGTIATIFAVQENFKLAALFVVLGIVFDFFDGFAARLLNVSGELGKQLDSLADMVTSGVVPGIIMYHLLDNASSG
ncbi:CDP-alcohol phosphatidyltransferase family protein, partial [Polaribacter sp.]|nr:CDP-alcohol phosphatidyltransferase family protein [Polaribacter sp.]